MKQLSDAEIREILKKMDPGFPPSTIGKCLNEGEMIHFLVQPWDDRDPAMKEHVDNCLNCLQALMELHQEMKNPGPEPIPEPVPAWVWEKFQATTGVGVETDPGGKESTPILVRLAQAARQWIIETLQAGIPVGWPGGMLAPAKATGGLRRGEEPEPSSFLFPARSFRLNGWGVTIEVAEDDQWDVFLTLWTTEDPPTPLSGLQVTLQGPVETETQITQDDGSADFYLSPGTYQVILGSGPEEKRFLLELPSPEGRS